MKEDSAQVLARLTRNRWIPDIQTSCYQMLQLIPSTRNSSLIAQYWLGTGTYSSMISQLPTTEDIMAEFYVCTKSSPRPKKIHFFLQN